MNVISQETLISALVILGSKQDHDDEVSDRIAGLVSDPIDEERLSVWPPEAFAMILISHSWNVILPRTFSAKSSEGVWEQFEFKKEPVFVESLKVAEEMFHTGSRNLFGNIAVKSSMIDTINKALNSGESIDGATLGGPALLGITAEFYRQEKQGRGSSRNRDNSAIMARLRNWLGD